MDRGKGGNVTIITNSELDMSDLNIDVSGSDGGEDGTITIKSLSQSFEEVSKIIEENFNPFNKKQDG